MITKQMYCVCLCACMCVNVSRKKVNDYSLWRSADTVRLVVGVCAYVCVFCLYLRLVWSQEVFVPSGRKGLSQSLQWFCAQCRMWIKFDTEDQMWGENDTFQDKTLYNSKNSAVGGFYFWRSFLDIVNKMKSYLSFFVCSLLNSIIINTVEENTLLSVVV